MKKIIQLLILIISISVFAQPANDNCIDATVINVSSTVNQNYTFDFTNANIETDISSVPAITYGDVWFEFTMPVDGNIFISSPYNQNKFQLFNTCNDFVVSALNIIATNNNLGSFTKNGFFYNLTANVTYKLRVYRASNLLTAFGKNFNIKAFDFPVNDDCIDASILNVTTSNLQVPFELRGAQPNFNETNCIDQINTNDYTDIWYEFTMPVNGNVYINGTNNINNFAIYNDCGQAELFCFKKNGYGYNLVANQTYKLRVFRTVLNTGSSFYYSFTIQAFETPLNDDCINAEVVNVSTATNLQVPFELRGTQPNFNETNCIDQINANDYTDIWYEFTMPVNGNVYINGTNNINNFSIYNDCGQAELSCFKKNGYGYNLVANQTYKLRVFRTIGNTGSSFYYSFTIQAFEIPINDDCVNAELITVDTATTLQVPFELRGAQPNFNETNCIDAINPDDYTDIWYEFTMPVTGNVYINGTNNINNFSIYNDCGQAELFCFKKNGYGYNLIANQTYKLRVFRTIGNTGSSFYYSFTIQAFEAPINDDCINAELITVDTATTLQVPFELRGTQPNFNETNCIDQINANDYTDIWYEFTMPVNGNIYINGTNNINNFSIYNDCGQAELSCFKNNGYGYNLVANQTYKIRVFRTVGNTGSSFYYSFTIQAFETPINDDCVNAEIINVTTNNSLQVSFDLRGVIPTINETLCINANPDDYTDAWYEFTMPVNGVIYINGTNNINDFALYNDCGQAELNCFNNNSYTYNLIAGQTYKLQVFRTVGNTGTPFYYSFSIQAFEEALNDDCVNAEIINITNVDTNIAFELRGAIVHNELGCSSDPINDFNDVWYAFTMPTDADVQLDGFSNINQFALYDACNGNELYCFVNQGNYLSLTSGNTYYLRVFRRFSDINNNSFKNFNIKMTGVTYVPDDNFEQALIDLTYDNVLDDYVQTANINSIVNLTISNKNITDLIGIEDFIALEILTCNSNFTLTNLDLSNNINLRNLNCRNCGITNLNITQCPNLVSLICNSNNLQNIDVSQNILLENLNCSGNELTSLNLNNNIALIDFNSNANLMLNNLDFSNCINLETIFCQQNNLTTLSVTNNVNLTSLVCTINQIASLDLSQNPNLIFLDCGINQLSSLSFINNLNLESINCTANNISVLDLSMNSQLDTLLCGINQLTSLDLSLNTLLTKVECFNNQLTSLDIKNGNNTIIATSDFNSNNNPDLLCIEVDDPVWSTANWTNIDLVSSFSDKCASIWYDSYWNYLPEVTRDAIFKHDYTTTVYGNLITKSLTIDALKTVTINANNYIKTENDIVNNGQFTIDKSGSLVQINNNATVTGSGTFTTKTATTTLLDKDRFTYFSSPVQNQDLTVFSSFANMNRLWRFDETVQDWYIVPSNTQMTPAIGYAIQGKPAIGQYPLIGNADFDGAFNNGIFSYPLTFNVGGIDDDNALVGNPYPSAIDAALLLNNNAEANAFYFWTHDSALNLGAYTGDDYAIWNNSGGIASGSGSPAPSGFIATGQGFFVDAVAAGNIVFDNSIRVETNNNDFRNTTVSENQKVWLNLTNTDGLFSQTLLNFDANASADFDTKLDATRFSTENPISFYSNGINNERFAIQALPLLNEFDIVPLGIEVSSDTISNLKISIDHSEFLENTTIYLKDNLLNITHDLSISAYEFSISEGEFNQRFELIFNRNALNVANNFLNQEYLIISNHTENEIKVATHNGEIITNFKAYDILGKLILDKKPNQNNFIVKTPNINQGTVLFVKAKLESGKMLNVKFLKL